MQSGACTKVSVMYGVARLLLLFSNFLVFVPNFVAKFSFSQTNCIVSTRVKDNAYMNVQINQNKIEGTHLEEHSLID